MNTHRSCIPSTAGWRTGPMPPRGTMNTASPSQSCPARQRPMEVRGWGCFDMLCMGVNEYSSKPEPVVPCTPETYGGTLFWFWCVDRYGCVTKLHKQRFFSLVCHVTSRNALHHMKPTRCIYAYPLIHTHTHRLPPREDHLQQPDHAGLQHPGRDLQQQGPRRERTFPSLSSHLHSTYISCICLVHFMCVYVVAATR